MGGVYANARDLERCRRELKEFWEEWIVLGVSGHQPFPIVDAIRFVVEKTI